MNRSKLDALWHEAEEQSRKEGVMYTRYHFAALVAAAAKAEEREACAEKTGEFARKWWSIHCDSNKHMETTRKAHDDFCALQAAIRARKETT